MCYLRNFWRFRSNLGNLLFLQLILKRIEFLCFLDYPLATSSSSTSSNKKLDQLLQIVNLGLICHNSYRLRKFSYTTEGPSTDDVSLWIGCSLSSHSMLAEISLNSFLFNVIWGEDNLLVCNRFDSILWDGLFHQNECFQYLLPYWILLFSNSKGSGSDLIDSRIENLSVHTLCRARSGGIIFKGRS